MDDRIKRNRETIKPRWLDLYTVNSAKRQGLEQPEQFLKSLSKSNVVNLTKQFPNIKQKTLSEVINNRRSLREYNNIYLTFT